MDSTEHLYAERYLEPRIADKKYKAYYYECMRFKIDEGQYWTPDFFVATVRGKDEIHEIKTSKVRESELIKIKKAADLYPNMKFKMLKRNYRSNGSGFLTVWESK